MCFKRGTMHLSMSETPISTTAHTTNAPLVKVVTQQEMLSECTSLGVTENGRVWIWSNFLFKNNIPLSSSVSLAEFVTGEEILRHCTPVEKGLMCTICGKVYHNRANAVLHIKDLHFHDGSKYKCPTCQTLHRTRNAFRVHIYMKHKDWKGVDMEKFVVGE